jgi:hypothetical protein
MRNMLAFLAALTLVVAGLGWFLDWYKVRSATLPSGNHNVNIEIDSSKFYQDLQKGEEKFHHLLEKKSQEQNAKSETPDKTAKDKASIPGPSGR